MNILYKLILDIKNSVKKLMKILYKLILDKKNSVKKN